MAFLGSFSVNASNLRRSANAIESDFQHVTTMVSTDTNPPMVTPIHSNFTFHTKTDVPKLGVMLVGWGGNNGTTVTASILANHLNVKWNTKTGEKSANYFGSMLMSSTTRLGVDEAGNEVFAPMNSILPMVNPSDIAISGWDICQDNLADAMRSAAVLDYDLQRQMIPHLAEMRPLPSVYYDGFIASNQSPRATSVLPGTDKRIHLDTIRTDIRDFKRQNNVDSVIVLWTATTERFCDIIPGVNDTADNLLAAINSSHDEVSPSTIFAVASILEGSSYINGSPQNTFVPGCIQLAEKEGVFIGGDDFKSGQTKLKSVMVDFLVGAGIKPTSIVSYNHLGNNDGKNLSEPSQFRSKEISKSNVVDDMVSSNRILYAKDEHPDHVVVIKYVPTVGDSKRALDEITSEIFMGGISTIITHNTCEDSLLAAPIIIDLVLLCELAERIRYKTDGMDDFENFHPVLSMLSYLVKAPLVPEGAPVVNALFKQRMCIENLLRVCAGLPVENDLRLEHRTRGVKDFWKKPLPDANGLTSNGHGHCFENGNGSINGNVNGHSNGNGLVDGKCP